MTTNTLLLLLLSLLIAAGLSFFQYIYKAKNKSKVGWFLAFLRFLSIFGILLLLINPIITKDTLETVKTPLPIVVDNSSSISFLNANEKALELYQKIKSNAGLQEKFDVQSFQFSDDFEPTETFDFNGDQTNIDVVAKNLKSINKNAVYPTVLITDGNQTSGNDYAYSFDAVNKVYPVIVGDTTTFLDFKINQLNVNKYAFHKNKFPVEAFLQYSGTKSVTADFIISQGNSVFSKQSITFSPSKKTVTISVLLPADKIGLQVFKATISSKEKEKNTYNNTKNFAVEVIDQKTNIAIVSAINHPDLGALKRAIESNVQRKVTIVKPNEIKSLQDYNVLILYQPTTEFKTIFDNNKGAGINTFIITGNNTDFNFLNQQQDNLNFKMSGQKEDYLSVFNAQFNLFATDNIGFENLPPLQNAFGTITTKGVVSVLLSSKIRAIDMNVPLLAFAENQGKRAAYLLGENSWKWRLQTHVNNQSFEKYDVFIDKIIQFLASNNSKKSLVVEHESFYNSGEAIEITAQFFNKNYEFDEKARLTIAVTNTKTKQTKNYDLLKGNNSYKVNLDGLKAGSYVFTVKELNSKTTYSSSFEILDFDIEKQFVNPDVEKLTQLATQTQGKAFFLDQVDVLIKTLLENDEYKAIEKNIVTKTPLIDWIWLLVLISFLLATEWFVRKYNGLL
jgi:ribosomal protein L4